MEMNIGFFSTRNEVRFKYFSASLENDGSPTPFFLMQLTLSNYAFYNEKSYIILYYIRVHFTQKSKEMKRKVAVEMVGGRCQQKIGLLFVTQMSQKSYKLQSDL